MSVSEQVDALQERAAELKSSADQARHETDEQIKARIDKTKADITARQVAVKAKAGQARRARAKSVEFDASRRRGQDAGPARPHGPLARLAGRQKAERQAGAAEEEAADALDYALWVIA